MDLGLDSEDMGSQKKEKTMKNYDSSSLTSSSKAKNQDNSNYFWSDEECSEFKLLLHSLGKKWKDLSKLTNRTPL